MYYDSHPGYGCESNSTLGTAVYFDSVSVSVIPFLFLLRVSISLVSSVAVVDGGGFFGGGGCKFASWVFPSFLAARTMMVRKLLMWDLASVFFIPGTTILASSCHSRCKKSADEVILFAFKTNFQRSGNSSRY